MALILITGLPGIGKSTVCAELKARGYDSYDADEDGLAHWYDREGNAIEPQNEQRTRQFVQSHIRGIAAYKIATLKAQSEASITFICGDPDNEIQLNSFFTDVYALVLDEDTRQRRITTRINNSWGKLAHEQERDIQFLQRTPHMYATYAYKLIDATQSPAEVVDCILHNLQMNRQNKIV